jgi:predicted DNA binding CopG/RHH family protein
MPLYILAVNEAKCLHALSLVNAFVADEQKRILSSNVAPDIDAMNASNEAVQLCMQELLNLEVTEGLKKENPSRLKATVLAVGARYQKYLKKVEDDCLEECKKGQIACDLG